MSDSQNELLQDYKDNLLGVFGDPALVLTEGQGVYVTDANGKKYLDLLGGIAVNSIGYAHPDWVAAVSEQAGKLAHISNLFTSPQGISLAHQLLELTDAPEARTFSSPIRVRKPTRLPSSSPAVMARPTPVPTALRAPGCSPWRTRSTVAPWARSLSLPRRPTGHPLSRCPGE